MATKKKRKASVASQHPDSKGINPRRDSKRGKGRTAVPAASGHGTAKFRRNRSAVE